MARLASVAAAAARAALARAVMLAVDTDDRDALASLPAAAVAAAVVRWRPVIVVASAEALEEVWIDRSEPSKEPLEVFRY